MSLLAGIRTVSRGDALLSPMATRALIGQYLAGADRLDALQEQARRLLAEAHRAGTRDHRSGGDRPV